MPTITRPGPISQPPPAPAPVVVVPRAQANDPQQKVSVSASGQVTISGVANNRGIVRSFVQLEFDGQKVNVGLSGGMHARDTMKAIAKALPRGYELKQVATRAYGDNAAFRIEKRAAPAQSNVKDIDAQFARAQKASSTAGTKVGVAELRKAVAAAEKGGLSAEDKDALARNWAGLFTGAGFRATPAAQKEYAKLQERLDLPVYPVR